MIRLKEYLDEIKKTNVLCVLLGNKVDLLHERKVSEEEGQDLGTNLSCAFFETSASDGTEQITEAFHELHRDIRRRKAVEGKLRRRSSAQQVRQVFNKMFNKMQNTP